MGIVEWQTVLTDVVSGVGVLLIGAVGGGFVGYFRAKKKSSLAIERKNLIYQPLLDELDSKINFKLYTLKNIETPILMDIVKNDYKYGLRAELEKKCSRLYSLIEQYNKISLVTIAHSKIEEIFINGYEEIFGSIVDGISIHTDREGNEWEIEHLVLPVELIQRSQFDKNIGNLICNEGMYDSEVCLDEHNNVFVSTYKELIDLYSSVLYATINGKRNQLPPLKKEIDMSPAEYIAVEFDFFEIFNKDPQKLKKDELRKEIKLESQKMVEHLKEIIRKIIDVYEHEEI
ncbi:hypothetical protein [Planococcus sp. ISL-110]|uniref:hypothetical protein n=1 Tax=Planococcus sp. ISL-110 TaxID=2819167 RepID=UPI001BEB4980|nr:hypothetical protein [Planococcus sp. ISL-110]MBT2571476.1 hypothetical protein [Planococcus sp. ISL-110]